MEAERDISIAEYLAALAPVNAAAENLKRATEAIAADAVARAVARELAEKG